MKKRIIISVLISLVLICIAFPYLKEYKFYSRAKKGNNIEYCDGYIENYPNGRYLADILEIKDSIAFMKVKDEQTSSACYWYEEVCPDGKHLEEVRYLHVGYSDNSLSAINDYLHDFPNGKYANEVNAICDSLWDIEIIKYTSSAKRKGSAAAIKYMNDMLQYMKVHRVNSVQVDVKSHLQLKDYEEYSSNVREFLEWQYEAEVPPLSQGMISIKSNFSEEDISTLMEILTDGVQNSFDQLFTPGFITVKQSSEEVKQSSEDLPRLHFDYTIKNQEERYGNTMLPIIWHYSQRDRFSNINIVRNYLIGISIFFKARYSIPGSATAFVYTEKGEPADNISDIEDISDGYRRMTRACFQQFSNKMSRNLGLKEAYTKDD